MDASGARPTNDGATDDDAVWLDLVARLQGVGDGTDEAAPGWPDEHGPAGGETDSSGRSNSGKDSTGTDSAGGADRAGGTASTARTFRDFDPLGLAGAAPKEPSAAERLRQAGGEPGAVAGDEGPDSASGPRDYEPEDDDGAFVPEVPPSLAGADPLTVLAWIGAVGGPVALVLSAMFWRSAPLLAILGMVAAFAASVVFLIMKLPGEKDENDDGARV
ncbi:hypothetical protein [Arthrobacter sp. ov118]|uniref:hypothetical protein n=1 Tax=Arthrobacter sp. ov118 TaxID=1761747 RepID=UPI000B83C5E8|nr:hypothetical protein [Arthrobacter sp. ov118]